MRQRPQSASPGRTVDAFSAGYEGMGKASGRYADAHKG